MGKIVTSGYTGIYRPPFNDDTIGGSTIYCVSTQDHDTLIMIILSPHFFNDAYNLIKIMQYKDIYLAPVATDAMFISDIYNLYREVTINLKKNFHLLCTYEPNIPTSDDFKTHIHKLEHEQITLWSNNIDQIDVTIDFSIDEMPIARNGADIILWDGEKKVYFANYITERKANTLLNDKRYSFDEIHIPFSTTLYGGLSYLNLVKQVPAIIPYLRVHSFSNTMELEYAKSTGIKIGRDARDDFS